MNGYDVCNGDAIVTPLQTAHAFTHAQVHTLWHNCGGSPPTPKDWCRVANKTCTHQFCNGQSYCIVRQTARCKLPSVWYSLPYCQHLPLDSCMHSCDTSGRRFCRWQSLYLLQSLVAAFILQLNLCTPVDKEDYICSYHITVLRSSMTWHCHTMLNSCTIHMLGTKILELANANETWADRPRQKSVVVRSHPYEHAAQLSSLLLSVELRVCESKSSLCLGAGSGAVLPPAGTSPHVLANAIKHFLVTMPEPLLTYK